MKTLDVILLVCRVASIVFLLIGVSYWLKAGFVQITTRDKNPHNPELEMRGKPDSEEHRVLYSSTAMEQTKLNKFAAIYTAIGLVFQAAATFLDMLR